MIDEEPEFTDDWVVRAGIEPCQRPWEHPAKLTDQGDGQIRGCEVQEVDVGGVDFRLLAIHEQNQCVSDQS